MKLSIVIASHGSEDWRDLAISRAFPSALRQGAHEVLIEHDPAADATRADVRNRLVERATGDWICHLDADDELALGYTAAMAAALERNGDREKLLLIPAISYAFRGRLKPPRFWPEIDLQNGNWIPIGTVLSRMLLLKVGGWKHLNGTGTTNEWDDWHLFSRCVIAGACLVKVPKAIYIAHVQRSSASRRARTDQHTAWFEEVRRDLWPELYPPMQADPAPPAR
jgi:hypothetical protein